MYNHKRQTNPQLQINGGTKMSNFMDFSTDKVDAFLMLIDKSGSMRDDESSVREGLRMYQKSFENFSEVNSIAVSVCRFADDFYSDEFKHVSNLNLSYGTGGGTALYYSIYHGAKYLTRYINEVTEAKGIVPRATFIVFSDGEPCGDRMSRGDAKKAIEDLNYAGVTTVFVAFGESIHSDFGKNMGFMSVIDVTDRDTLVNFLGVELSKSCKEQSKSMKSLGANFFSQAVGTTESERFSQATTQALEDTDWIDDI